jgi:hypothetical protein
MKPTAVRAVRVIAATVVMAATVLTFGAARARGDSIQNPAPGTKPVSTTNQTATLPPIIKAILAEVHAREKEMKRRGPMGFPLPYASFPLPLCLFERGLCGAINQDGSIAVPPQFDFVDEFHEGRALVRLRGLYGYVDTAGKIVVEPRYPVAGRYRLGFAEVDVDGKSALIDRDGKQIFEPRFAGAVPFTKSVIWVNTGERDFSASPMRPRGAEELQAAPFRNTGRGFRDKAKWGLIDINGTWIRPPEFRDLAGFDPENDNLTWALADTGWGLIRQDGTWQLEPAIRHKHELSDGRAEVWIGDRSGYIDRNGAIAIPPKFDIDPGFYSFGGGMAPAQVGGRVGLIDRAGNWIVEPTFDRIYPLGGNVDNQQFAGFVVERRGKHGLLDPSGNVVIAPALEQYKDPLASARRSANGGIVFTHSLLFFPMFCPDGRIIGLIDQKPWFFARDGKPLILPEGEVAWPPSCDTPIAVKIDDQFTYVDGALQPITSRRFEVAGRFHAGLAAVKLDGKFGLIRADGSWATEPKFDTAQPLQSNLALAKRDGRAGIVDVTTGAWVTQARFDEVCLLGRGIVGAVRDGKMGAIDDMGHSLIEPNYEPFSFNFYQDFIPVQSGGKWGFLDAAGNTIEARFDDASRFERGASWVKGDGNWCAIDRSGNKIPTLQCQSEKPRYIERPDPASTLSCQIRP